MRKLLDFVATGALLLLTAGTLHAQDSRWTRIGSPTLEPNLRADFSSVVSGPDGAAILWVRADFVTTQAADHITDTGARTVIHFRQAMTRFAIDCRQKRLTLLAGVRYDGRNNVVSSITADSALAYSKWAAPAPEGVGEAIVRGVCDHLGRGADSAAGR